MSLKFSLNIFLTKVRAMYSLRVKSEDYKKIVAYKSVRDVLKFLKENRFYGSALERVTENSEDVDLLSVERLLNYKFLDILELISKYDKLLGGYLKDYISSYIDVKLIFECFEKILKLRCGEDFFYDSSKREKAFKNPKLKGLVHVKRVEEFFDFLKNSGYRRVFKELDLKKDIFFIQSFLQKTLYEDLHEKLLFGISNIKNKKSKKELFSIFCCYLELRDFVYKLRFKRIDVPDSSILPSFKSLEQKILKNLEKLHLESEYFEFLKGSFLYSQIKNIKYFYLEQLPEKFLFFKCKKNIRFSSEPTVVLVSFINLLKIETQNIIKILEGIRCKLPENKITELLVI